MSKPHARTIEKNCLQCGKAFPARTDRDHRFCSTRCYGDYNAAVQGTAERFWRRVNKTEGCWLWEGPNTGRYGYIVVNGHGMTAHRRAWILENGPIPDGLLACHHCDTPLCVRPDHLFLGTPADNARDMMVKGRASSGDAHYSRREPWRLARGDQNGARQHPETRARGESHGSRTTPEAIPRGEESGQAKLTTQDVLAIRAAATTGEHLPTIAARFGVTKENVYYIVKRVTWKHI